MRTAFALVTLALVAMAAALVYGFALGDGWDEVAELTAYPWFNVSLVDVYVGFALFCGWVIYRERSAGRSVAWIVFVLTLGNLIACLYVLIALARSRGDWLVFWLGPDRARVAARAS